LRCLSRHVYGTPEQHFPLRNTLLQYISDNLNASIPGSDGFTFHHQIQLDIQNQEHVLTMGRPPLTYNSAQEYLNLMAHPHAFATHLEIAAFQAMFNVNVHIFYAPSGNHPPPSPLPHTCYLHYSHEHYQTTGA